MAGLLISGPAGAGKSGRARRALVEAPGPAVVADFQSIYAALLLIERLPDGRFPERRDSQAYALATAEYARRAVITAAVERELFVIVTNSDGDAARRTGLLDLLGAGAQEEIIDPGADVVRERLAGPDGQLSGQCQEAIDRWYRRRNG